MDRTTFRMNPVTLFALIGAVVAFVAVGAIVETLWVMLGALVGAGIGFGVRRFANRAAAFEDAVDLRDSATKAELYEQAKELDIEGRASMTKDELVAAITDKQQV
jgi:uncharacterized membrane protein required for colicin V production